MDVREEGKENAFSLGRSLWINSEVCMGNPSDMSVKVLSFILFDCCVYYEPLTPRFLGFRHAFLPVGRIADEQM